MSLIIDRISKTYTNGVKALDELTLSIPVGMFGLLGPNGAGKSSLMRTIATLQPADAGSITFDGLDIMKEPLLLRKQLGYLPQDFGVYEGESAESLLDYFAILKGITERNIRRKRVEEVLELTNLSDVRKKNVSSYSGGMKRRFGIAQLLLNDPKLIIVDEPTAGLDPSERTRFLNVIRAIGTHSTVIFSTHIVADVKELCQHLAIINGGKVLTQGTTQDHIHELKGRIWQTLITPDQLKSMEASYQALSSSYEADDKIRIRVCSDTEPSGRTDDQRDWSQVDPDLSDVYFSVLNQSEVHV